MTHEARLMSRITSFGADNSIDWKSQRSIIINLANAMDVVDVFQRAVVAIECGTRESQIESTVQQIKYLCDEDVMAIADYSAKACKLIEMDAAAQAAWSAEDRRLVSSMICLAGAMLLCEGVSVECILRTPPIGFSLHEINMILSGIAGIFAATAADRSNATGELAEMIIPEDFSLHPSRVLGSLQRIIWVYHNHDSNGTGQ